MNRRELAKAEEMFKQALKGIEDALGSDHTSTLNTVNNLGILYRRQGGLGKAEEMLERALKGYKNALGPDHMSTSGTYNNLGFLFAGRGDLVWAVMMFERALEGFEKQFSSERPHCDSIRRVLFTLKKRADIDRTKAVVLLYRIYPSIRCKITILGQEHEPSTASYWDC
jgi:tetratricopeptide (TPR) repeat protein